MSNKKFLTAMLLSILFSFSCTLQKNIVHERKTEAIANMVPFEIGTTEIGVDTGFLGVKVVTQESTIMYHPMTNDISLEFKFFMNKVSLYLDRLSRAAFSNSLSKYISEYNAKELKTRGKTKQMYEGSRGLMKWGTITQNGESMPELRYGYVFTGNSVYYTITVYPGRNYHEASREFMDENPLITICLTIAQAKKLDDMLSEVSLRKALESKQVDSTNTEDTYFEDWED